MASARCFRPIFRLNLPGFFVLKGLKESLCSFFVGFGEVLGFAFSREVVVEFEVAFRVGDEAVGRSADGLCFAVIGNGVAF